MCTGSVEDVSNGLFFLCHISVGIIVEGVRTRWVGPAGHPSDAIGNGRGVIGVSDVLGGVGRELDGGWAV